MADGVSEETVRSLEAHARAARHAVLRMSRSARRPPGRSLAVCDLLAALCVHELRVAPDRVHDPTRDRLVLADPDATPALYAVLAQRGFLPPDELAEYGRLGSRLPLRADRLRLPGIEVSAAAPGLGIGVAVGLALGARLGPATYRTYALLGDEDRRAAATWAALAAAGDLRLSDLLVIAGGPAPRDAGSEAERLRALGYSVREIDGHDPRSIVSAFEEARRTREGPTFLSARTVLGRGASPFEGVAGTADRPPTDEEIARALTELPGPPGGAG